MTSDTRLPSDARTYVLMGPSGVGKTTLAASLAEDMSGPFKFKLNQAWRTRPKRPGEGDESLHISEAEFEQATNANKFLFTMQLHSDMSGTLVPYALPENTFWVYVYLPKYALKFREFYPNARLVEILPEDATLLQERMLARDPNISPDELAQRQAAIEMEIHDGQAIADLIFVNQGPLETAKAEFYDLICNDIKTQPDLYN